MNYRKRIADILLKDELEAMGAVLIEGPKACGKTTTGEQHARSVIYVDDPEQRGQYELLAQTKIKTLLEGECPRLLDEWQLIPRLWDAVRFEVDHREGDGLFILTGSAVPPDEREITHSGTGRFGRIKMRPMSLWESGESSGSVSLEQLFDSTKQVEGYNKLDLDKIAFIICRGGWPKALDKKSEKAALRQVENYFNSIVNYDLSRVDKIKREPERTERIMRSYARFQGTQATIKSISEDISSNDRESVSDETISSYLSALRKIFVIEDMKAWNPNLKSKTAIRTSDTRYYIDPSIGVAALSMGPNDLINDMKTFGLFFESLCVRDLRVYAEALDGNVYHYRDKNGLECDAVIHLKNGKYGLVEIKIGGDKNIEEASQNLLKLSSLIDLHKQLSPSFLMVLTGVGDYAYTRPDGVHVVPIGCLKN